jgi:aryl-alcohol dehydrogenase-like predicted oxidoreductase
MLKRTAGAGAALALAPFSAMGTGAPEGLSADGLRTRPLPSSGEPLPVVGLGTWRQFDVGPNATEQRTALKKVLRRLVDLGGAVVDASPMYGRAEQVVGTLSAELGLTDEIFGATKVWTRGREDGIRQMERSMDRMRQRPMDLMQVHNLLDWQTHLDTLQSWKAEGTVRYVGVTHYTLGAFDDLASIIENRDIDTVQLPYSIETTRAEERLLPLAAENDVGVIVNGPFEGGALFGRVEGKSLPGWASDIDCESWAQFFLKYILGHEAVTCVIPGTSDPEHLRDNVRAGYGRLPGADTRERMRKTIRRL